MRFAEFTPGLMLLAGPRTVDGEEMIQFASRYDPQWFHLNAERAASRWELWNQGNRKALSMIGISLFEIAPAAT